MDKLLYYKEYGMQSLIHALLTVSQMKPAWGFIVFYLVWLFEDVFTVFSGLLHYESTMKDMSKTACTKL